MATLFFAAGYQFALITNATHINNSPDERFAQASPVKVFNAENDSKQANRLENDDTENNSDMHFYSDDDTFFELKVETAKGPLNKPLNNDIDNMLANIEDAQLKGENAHIIGQQFDTLKQFLFDNPDQLVDTMQHLDSLSIDDPRFNLLISAVQSIPDQGADQALFSLAKQYGMSSDPQAQQKFVTILASTSSVIETQEIIEGLVDLAIIDTADMNTRIEALNLLKPFQVKAAEKELIVKELQTNIYAANGAEADMLLPQLMRFAIAEQRNEIVTDLFINAESESVRLAVLDNISAGSIPVSDNMKTMLMEIAKNEFDPLSNDAKMTLMERFDLSHSEYSQL